MDLLTQTLKSVLLPLAEALLCALLGYLGIRIRGIYVRFINGREKEAVARIAVQATEQICRELHGKEKLDAALAHMSELLAARGIPFEATEATVLIEAAVAEFNRALRGDKTAPAAGGFATDDPALA